MLRSLLPFTACALCSCATIVSPGPDTIHVTSEPSGARVLVDGEDVGATPTDVAVQRSVSFITLSKPGWAEAKVRVRRHMNGWIWGNILLGGVIGIIVDAVADNLECADGELHGTLWRQGTPVGGADRGQTP